MRYMIVVWCVVEDEDLFLFYRVCSITTTGGGGRSLCFCCWRYWDDFFSLDEVEIRVVVVVRYIDSR